MESPKIQRALISVSDKTGLAAFGKSLADAGVEIYSTGGTRRHLEESGVAVRDVAGYTGFPEMMDGRLKTLHPKVFGGILCRRDREDDMQAMAAHEIVPFDLVVVIEGFGEDETPTIADWTLPGVEIEAGLPAAAS